VKTAIPVDLVLAGPGLEELFQTRVRRHARGAITIPVASPEDLIAMKILAGRPRDIEDVRSVLRAVGPELDVPVMTETLSLLERALGQSDLLPLLKRLRREAARKIEAAPRARRVASSAKVSVKKRKRQRQT
jgi:hypothetical protein